MLDDRADGAEIHLPGIVCTQFGHDAAHVADRGGAQIRNRLVDGGDQDGLSEADLTAILSKMVKQRQESAKAYEEGGRLELAERELDEIALIQSYLPRQLDEAEVRAAIDKAIADLGAESIRDMGRVMAELRSQYAGQMDFSAVGPAIKERLMK